MAPLGEKCRNLACLVCKNFYIYTRKGTAVADSLTVMKMYFVLLVLLAFNSAKADEASAMDRINAYLKSYIKTFSKDIDVFSWAPVNGGGTFDYGTHLPNIVIPSGRALTPDEITKYFNDKATGANVGQIDQPLDFLTLPVGIPTHGVTALVKTTIRAGTKYLDAATLFQQVFNPVIQVPTLYADMKELNPQCSPTSWADVVACISSRIIQTNKIEVTLTSGTMTGSIGISKITLRQKITCDLMAKVMRINDASALDLQQTFIVTSDGNHNEVENEIVMTMLRLQSLGQTSSSNLVQTPGLEDYLIERVFGCGSN